MRNNPTTFPNHVDYERAKELKRYDTGLLGYGGYEWAAHFERKRDEVIAQRDVLNGTFCIEEQKKGSGPCGACITCLRAKIKDLEFDLDLVKRLSQAKLPCGHFDRYGYTDDGGKTGFCSLCIALQVVNPQRDNSERMEQLRTLEAAAEVASQGPWALDDAWISNVRAEEDCTALGFPKDDQLWGVAQLLPDGSRRTGLATCWYEKANGKNDAAYIALANPKAILDLIHEFKVMRETNKWLNRRVGKMRKRLRQEPRGYVRYMNFFARCYTVYSKLYEATKKELDYYKSSPVRELLMFSDAVRTVHPSAICEMGGDGGWYVWPGAELDGRGAIGLGLDPADAWRNALHYLIARGEYTGCPACAHPEEWGAPIEGPSGWKLHMWLHLAKLSPSATELPCLAAPVNETQK